MLPRGQRHAARRRARRGRRRRRRGRGRRSGGARPLALLAHRLLPLGATRSRPSAPRPLGAPPGRLSPSTRTLPRHVRRQHGVGSRAAAHGARAQGAQAGGGWLGMRTVAQLRRAAGVGAPRQQDSLYRPIERRPRRFNPLKIPTALQARCTPLPCDVPPIARAARPGAAERAPGVAAPAAKRADAARALWVLSGHAHAPCHCCDGAWGRCGGDLRGRRLTALLRAGQAANRPAARRRAAPRLLPPPHGRMRTCGSRAGPGCTFTCAHADVRPVAGCCVAFTCAPLHALLLRELSGRGLGGAAAQGSRCPSAAGRSRRRPNLTLTRAGRAALPQQDEAGGAAQARRAGAAPRGRPGARRAARGQPGGAAERAAQRACRQAPREAGPPARGAPPYLLPCYLVTLTYPIPWPGLVCPSLPSSAARLAAQGLARGSAAGGSAAASPAPAASTLCGRLSEVPTTQLNELRAGAHAATGRTLI